MATRTAQRTDRDLTEAANTPPATNLADVPVVNPDPAARDKELRDGGKRLNALERKTYEAYFDQGDELIRLNPQSDKEWAVLASYAGVLKTTLQERMRVAMAWPVDGPHRRDLRQSISVHGALLKGIKPPTTLSGEDRVAEEDRCEAERVSILAAGGDPDPVTGEWTPLSTDLASVKVLNWLNSEGRGPSGKSEAIPFGDLINPGRYHLSGKGKEVSEGTLVTLKFDADNVGSIILGTEIDGETTIQLILARR